ncbi:copper chaperone PCu(A)C [Paenalcaligenes hominis]|uniref:copper chaperone PCu(A)C n=1 Tax=Paenalcaligenes hominis TaxID=643674 RepID=UPI0035239FB9
MRNVTFAILCGFSSLALAHGGHHHDSAHHHEMVDYAAQFAAAKPAVGVRVEQCWVRLLPPTVPSAGYFVIHNDSNEELELVAGATPSYGHVMLHETIEENGMAKMVMADKMVIPAQSMVEFKPGGLHAMFEQPTQALTQGQTMDMELLFSNQKKVAMSCKVNPANARSY